MTLDDLWGHASFNAKFASLCCWYSWKVLKSWKVEQKYNAEKDDFEILRWPFVTSNDLWVHTSIIEKF